MVMMTKNLDDIVTENFSTLGCSSTHHHYDHHIPCKLMSEGQQVIFRRQMMISTTQVKDSFPFPPPLSPATFQEALEPAPGCNFDILK